MSQCNYCILKRMKVRAKHENKRIVVHHIGAKDKENWGMGGVNIHAIPPGEKVAHGNLRAWFMELPANCEC